MYRIYYSCFLAIFLSGFSHAIHRLYQPSFGVKAQITKVALINAGGYYIYLWGI